ncbi:hypothetical protein GQ600_19385 [Phytophthora cactorum]|nr:hypothetical protein GQ600_19385 [Phytophthora cactorum]
MHLKTKIKRNQYVGIDAVNAAVRFHEAKTRDTVTLVAVTVRDV